MPTNGVGNITNAPQFVNYPGGDLRQNGVSPCIDAGDNSAVATSVDLAGYPRITRGTVDMGAYEGGVAAADIVTLTMNVSPAGSGRISPATGTVHYYGRDEAVLLLAQPLGYRFEAWTGSFTSPAPMTTFLTTGNAVITASFAQRIVHVNAAQKGPADGITWATAYRTIQEGVSAAADGGGEVWVAQGAYTGNRRTVLTLQPGVYVYGGFAGTETAADRAQTTETNLAINLQRRLPVSHCEIPEAGVKHL